MTAPILRLYPDLWASLFAFLDFGSIFNLIRIGNVQLSSTVRHNVHRIDPATSDDAVLNLEALLQCVARFESIKELTITPSDRIHVKRPLLPLDFPITLTSLSLHFDGVFSVITQLPLSTLLPNLITLDLEGVNNLPDVALKSIDFPPKLETLKLLSWENSLIGSLESISELPRTLTTLGIHAPEKFCPEQGAILSSYPWPPRLVNLRLTVYDGSFSAEYLPRTVTKMKVVGALETAYPRSNGNSVFPWRRFFPALTSLQTSGSYLHTRSFWRTLLFDAGHIHNPILDATEVDNFISSGVWDLPSLRHPASYPAYTTVRTSHFNKLVFTCQEKEINFLSPWLQSIDLGHFNGSYAQYKSMASALRSTRFLIIAGEIEKGQTIPSHVTTLVVPARPVTLSSLSPSLTTLDCGGIEGGGADGSYMPGDAFPPKLNYLNAARNSTPTPLEFASLIPTTMTDLNVMLDSPKSWDVIAERLVSLERLYFSVTCPWPTSNPPLARIASKRLSSVTLIQHPTFWSEKPRLAEFFPTTDPFSPSALFPPTMMDLTLEGMWHASVSTILPRNLKFLSIDKFAWGDHLDSIAAYPEATGMSNAELIQALPANLRSLSLQGPFAEMVAPHFEDLALVQFLPQSLTYLCETNVFNSFLASSGEEEITKLLPKNLLTCSLSGFSPNLARNKEGYLEE